MCSLSRALQWRLTSAPSRFITDGSPEADERRFVACVDQYCGRTTHLIQQDDSFELVDPMRHWITPAQPVYGTLQSYKLVRNSGGRLLLTGHGGDAVMGNFVDYYYDVAALLRRGRSSRPCGLRARGRLRRSARFGTGFTRAALNLSPELAVRRKLAELFEGSGACLPRPISTSPRPFLLKPEFVVFWKDAWTKLFARAFAFPDVSQWDLAIGVTLMGERRHAQAPSDEPLALYEPSASGSLAG